jgi:hypothetical protein
MGLDINLPQDAEIVNMKDDEYENENPIRKLEDQKEEPTEPLEPQKSFSEDDLFKIKNIDTGESFDIRHENLADKVNQSQQVTLKGVPWNNFW